MANGSDRAASYATTHSFLLLRVSAGMRAEAFTFLEDLEKELIDIVQSSKAPAARTQKYNEMLAEAQAAIAYGYTQIKGGQKSSLSELAGIEWQAGNAMVNRAIGVDIVSGKIPAATLSAVVNGPSVLGAPAMDWWNGQSADLRMRFQREMALGTMLGESVNDLVKRLQGKGIIQSEKNLFGTGIIAKSKGDAANLVRTSVQSISNTARIEHFKSKPHLIKGLQWVATLDSRTTLICMALDGKQWRLPDFEPIGHDKKFPGATAHWSCRSTQISVLYSWEELSGKKLPELDEQTVQEAIEKTMAERGADTVTAAKAYARASMDGQVSKGHTFGTWADEKGKAFVDQVVGKNRAEMLKAGQITWSDLTDQTNRPVTIQALKTAVETGKLPPEITVATFLPPRVSAAVIARKAEEKTKQAEADLAKARDELFAKQVAERELKQAAAAARKAQLEAERAARQDPEERWNAIQNEFKALSSANLGGSGDIPLQGGGTMTRQNLLSILKGAGVDPTNLAAGSAISDSETQRVLRVLRFRKVLTDTPKSVKESFAELSAVMNGKGSAKLTPKDFHDVLAKANDAKKKQVYTIKSGAEEDLVVKIKEAQAFMDRMVADSLKGGTYKFVEHVDFGANYSRTERTVRLSMESPITTVVHEIGHHYEYQAKAFKRAKALVDKRKPEDWVKMGGRKYSAKLYPGATEVFSTGAERLLMDPLEFWQTDPEHFEMTVRTFMDLW